MQPHSPDRPTFDFYDQDNVLIGFLAETLHPFLFALFRDREYGRDELPDFRVIEPAQEKRYVLFRDWSKRDLLAFEEKDAACVRF